MNKTFFVALGAVAASMSMAQTVTVPGTVNFGGVVGSGDNSNVSGLSPVTTSFVVGAGVTFASASITSLNANTYALDATMRIKNSGYPALFGDVDFTSLYDTFTVVSVPSGTVRSFLAGSTLGGSVIATGTTWSMECWDSYDDGAGADESASSIAFTINGLPPTVYTFSAAGPIQSLANGPFSPLNPTLTGPAVGTAFDIGATAIGSGTYTQTVAGDWPVDTVVIIRNSARPGDWAWTRPLPWLADVASTTITNSVVTLGGPMLGQTMASGTTMTLTFSNNPTDGVAGGEEATISAFSLKFTAAGAPVTPPTAVDLGAISASTSPLLSALGSLGASEVKWHKFTLGAPVGASFGSTFLDVFTSGGSADDTEVGVYNSKGYLVSTDDDDDDGLFSALSFGTGGNLANGFGIAFDGRDGDLPAGTYYVATGEYDTTFNNGFDATSTGPGTLGAVNLTLRTNLPASNQVISGTLNLGDTGAFGVGLNRTIGYTVKQGTTTVGTGSVIASSSATSFNISLANSLTGSANIVWDGSSFLKRNTAVSLTGSNQAVGSVTMQNGDPDHSGEVDAADIDLVIANFGTLYPGGPTPDTDVDVSGEVDAADIDIVIANFGGLDD